MEIIRSRQNETIKKFIALANDAKTRQAAGEYICAGRKLLEEAVSSGAEITCVLDTVPTEGLPHRVVTPELLAAATPLQNCSGPVFSVKMKQLPAAETLKNVIVLENVQDPGNVGTVLRTAGAFGIDLVVLCGACADPYNPKTARATMGAIFRQPVVRTDVRNLSEILGGMPIYGAQLAQDAADIRTMPHGGIAVAIGNEGHGLSEELLSQCAGSVIIPMPGHAESLNAGVAAAIAMWEMVRSWQG